MRELKAIVQACSRMEPSDSAALATVVSVEGSAYRRPGARMLITPAGRVEGSISGGCLESDVCERAQRVMASGDAALITYDTGTEEDLLFGNGLGCNGVVRVLIERLDLQEQAESPISLLRECLEQRHSGAMATLICAEGALDDSPGAHLMLHSDGRLSGDIRSVELRRMLQAAMEDSLQRGRSGCREFALPQGCVEVFCEVVRPPVSLILFGGGYDAIPLARFACQLGWNVTVADHRPAYASPERFEGTEVICVRPESIAERVPLTADSVAVVMTHNYAQDRELLRTLLPRRLRYLGVLGPRARTVRLVHEIQQESALNAKTALDLLHGPAGLDIGAESPEEIALSILAEIKAVLTHHEAGMLKDSGKPIH